MIDIRQTPQYAKYLKSVGWNVERINEANYFIKKFPLIGSVIKIQRPEEINNKVISQIASKYRVFQIIVEPKGELDAKYLLSLGYRKSKSSYLPTKTLQLDLTKSKRELYKDLKKDCKNALRKTMNYELRTMNSVEEFHSSWKSSVGWKRYIPPLTHLVSLRKSFKNNSLFLISKTSSSGAIFLTGDKIGYYWQAFTSKEGRKLQSQYKIVWEGILWTKKKGAKVFDFEGIYDERFPNKSWLGFTHFKRSFGGYEIEYPGIFTQNRLPI